MYIYDFFFFYLFAGAIICTADLDDPKSLERAVDGADTMFLTTHYWEDKNKEKEVIRVCMRLWRGFTVYRFYRKIAQVKKKEQIDKQICIE